MPATALVAAPAPGWRALDHLAEGRYTLPELSTPPGAASSGTFPVGDGWERVQRSFGRLKVWERPLPFPCDMPRPNYAPWGARLYRGTRELPFVTSTEDLAGGGWYIQEGKLVLLTLEDPNRWSQPGELRVPEIAEAVRRRSFGTAGVSAAEFVLSEATVGPVTRRGVLIPAPGQAAWTVQIPSGATLETAVALLPDPVLGPVGDGADVEIRLDGTRIWGGSAEPGETWQDVRVDLGAYAGRTVELALVTSPRADGSYDHVVYATPTVVAPLGRPPRHVVVVGIDTLRWDALSLHGYGLPTSPELDRWAEGAVAFDQARAPAPRTRPSFRTALTGAYPVEAINSRTLAEHLGPQGFRTAGVVANVHLVPRFHFSDGFETWIYENGAQAEEQVERALAWQRAHQDEDTFLFLHLMDPHTHYRAPTAWDSRFTAGKSSPRIPAVFDRWQIVQMTRRGALTEEDKALVRARYDAEVAYTSHSLGGFFEELEALRGRTVSVLLTDHGEEFWDHGGFEHNHTLYDELVRAVLWIRPPGGWGGGPHRLDAPVGLVDVVPTLLDLVGAPVPPELDGRSLRPFVDADAAAGSAELDAALRARPQPIGHLMFDRERWAVVSGGWKYILQTANGQEEAYDLVADPGERRNLAREAPADRLLALRQDLERSTGFPVGPGWRIRLPKAARVAFQLQFDAPIRGVEVVDPEADLQMRANLEWGERPRLLTAQVGQVQVAPDLRSARFVGGPDAEGQRLAILCADTCPGATIDAGAGPVALVPGVVDLGVGKLSIEAGTVVFPHSGEAEALSARPESEQLEALKVLGYIDGH